MAKENVDGSFAKNDWRNVVVSAFGPALACLFTNPFDVARVRLQMEGEGLKGLRARRVYSGPMDVIARNWSSDGLSGVQRGLGVAVLRESTKCSVRIGLYEPFSKYLRDNGVQGAPVVAAVITGGASAFLFNPLDMIKSRTMAAGSHGTPCHHSEAERGAMAAVLA